MDRRLLRDRDVEVPLPEPAVGSRPVASIVVIDDHAVLADIVVTTLTVEGFHARAIAPTTLEGVLDECERLRPTLALLDLDLGCSELNGFDLIGPLLERGVDVVVLSGSQNRLLKAASLESGADAVIPKSEAFAVTLDAVRLAARGQLKTDPATRYELSRALREQRDRHAERLAPFAQLTGREREVLGLLMDGHPAEVIANRCFVSIATVRTQIRAILTKLGVTSQLGAVATAKRSGWSPDESAPLVRYSSTLSL